MYQSVLTNKFSWDGLGESNGGFFFRLVFFSFNKQYDSIREKLFL